MQKVSVNQLVESYKLKIHVQGGGAWDLVINRKDIWWDVKDIEKPGPESFK